MGPKFSKLEKKFAKDQSQSRGSSQPNVITPF